MPKYLIVYGEGDSWLTDAVDVEGVIKEYNQENIGGKYPIEHIYEMIDRTPIDIETRTTAGTETKEDTSSNYSPFLISTRDPEKPLPSWWTNRS